MNDQWKILRKPEQIELTGLSNTTLHYRTKAGLYPSNISLGGKAVGVPKIEILALNAARVAGYDDIQIKKLVSDLHAKRQDVLKSILSALSFEGVAK